MNSVRNTLTRVQHRRKATRNQGGTVRSTQNYDETPRAKQKKQKLSTKSRDLVLVLNFEHSAGHRERSSGIEHARSAISANR